ncbi:MAG TPA: acyl-CoA dehydrogenase, partial [Myxococcaceae bacterium]
SGVQKERWLRPLAAGEAILTPAWFEPENGFTPRGVEARAVAEGSGFRLSGLKRHVAFAAAADRLVVLARTGEAADAIDLFLVDPAAPGVRLRQQFSLASDTQYEVTLSGVVVSDEDRIGPPGSGWATWMQVLEPGLVLLAAQAVGGARYALEITTQYEVALSGVVVSAEDRIGPQGTGWATWQQVLEPGLVLLAAQAAGGARYALEITTQYAKDRWQFDKPLGAFQSLAHYLADAVTTLDGAEQLVHEAAWAGANGQPLTSLAPMAKLFACTTFRDITAMAQQIFGGIGFTLDFDIQLYFRRAKQQQLMWANDRTLEDAVAGALLD